MPQDTILTWRDYADEPYGLRPYPLPRGVSSYLDYLRHYHQRYQGVPAPAIPEGKLLPAYPEVSAGRWVRQCAGCGLAVPLERDQPVLCPGCGMGGWHSVEWPLEQDEIEAELLRQPGRRLSAPVRKWKQGWTLEDLRDRTARANELRARGVLNPKSLSIALTRVWTAGEIPTATNFNNHISTPIDDLSGDNGLIELRDSLEVLDGSSGDRFIGFPAGNAMQRPSSPPVGATRLNTNVRAMETWDGNRWVVTSAGRHYSPRNAVSQGTLPTTGISGSVWDGMQLVIATATNLYTLARNMDGSYTPANAVNQGSFSNLSGVAWDGMQLVMTTGNAIWTLVRNFDGSYTPGNAVNQGAFQSPNGVGWDGQQLILIVALSSMWTLLRNSDGSYTPANAVNRGLFPSPPGATATDRLLNRALGVDWDGTQLVFASGNRLFTLPRNDNGTYTLSNLVDRGLTNAGPDTACWDELQLVMLDDNALLTLDPDI